MYTGLSQVPSKQRWFGHMVLYERPRGIYSIEDTLVDQQRNTILVGKPVYDPWEGRTKYEIRILKHGEDLGGKPEAYRIDTIPNRQIAEMAERELIVRLARKGVPADVRTKIMYFENHGYLVYALIIPDDNNHLDEIDAKLRDFKSEIGVPPGLVHKRIMGKYATSKGTTFYEGLDKDPIKAITSALVSNLGKREAQIDYQRLVATIHHRKRQGKDIRYVERQLAELVSYAEMVANDRTRSAVDRKEAENLFRIANRYLHRLPKPDDTPKRLSPKALRTINGIEYQQRLAQGGSLETLL